MSAEKRAMLKNKETLLPFVINHILEKDRQKAVVELNETPENRTNGLSKLKEMLKNDTVTKKTTWDDSFLQTFLRQGKYDVQKTFSRMKKFIDLGNNHRHFFESFPSDGFESEYCKIVTISPKRCPEGCPIIITKIGQWDPSSFTLENIQRLFTATILYCLRYPMTQINGIKFIHDFENSSFKQIRYLTPINVYFIMNIVLNCLPARYTQIHVVNESLFFKIFWSLCKHLMSEKLRNRIFLHSSPKDLHSFLPRSSLPSKYGGDLEDFYTPEWTVAANEYFGTLFKSGDDRT